MTGTLATPPAATRTSPARGLMPYFVLGTLFGIMLTKSQVASWFRIQEMFRFQSFYMYGVISSALAVAAASIALIKSFRLKTLGGEGIAIPAKVMGGGHRYWIGGTIFGLGWAMTGACPGPLFALFGAGVTVMIPAVLAALAGTWVYGYLRPKLPH